MQWIVQPRRSHHCTNPKRGAHPCRKQRFIVVPSFRKVVLSRFLRSAAALEFPALELGFEGVVIHPTHSSNGTSDTTTKALKHLFVVTIRYGCLAKTFKSAKRFFS